jgi:MFS superfamily sulfate permease-like transporter
VALVALPLALGIAVASNAPPMAGVLSAIIGGIVASFFKGGAVSIKGPAASQIVPILAAIAILNDGTMKTFQYVLAAVVLSGVVQVALGFFKLGRIAHMFPTSVIQGILAAIGVIIFAKQMHFAMGTTTNATSIIDTLFDVFKKMPDTNPFILILSVSAGLMLFVHPKLSSKYKKNTRAFVILLKNLPAPMWALVVSTLIAGILGFTNEHVRVFFGTAFTLSPQYLISLPGGLMEAIQFPDFSRVDELKFWGAVMSIAIIGSIETLASGRALDKLDPYQRKTNLNNDLMGVGAASMVSGALGGLPIITVIIRSTVNVTNGGKTRWANFWHGVLILIIVVGLTPVIELVPLAALAAILIFIGFKLASPQTFRDAFALGNEQLLILLATLITVLFSDLLRGIAVGVIVTLVVHLYFARENPIRFLKKIFSIGTLKKNDDGSYLLTVCGVANFLSILAIDKQLTSIPNGKTVTINLATSKLIDVTVMEVFLNFQRLYGNTGGTVEIVGLENHDSSKHAHGLHVLSKSAAVSVVS